MGAPSQHNITRAQFEGIADQLGLTERDGQNRRGPNPFTHDGKNGFVWYWPQLNASDRTGSFKKSSREMLEFAGASKSAPTLNPSIKRQPLDWNNPQTVKFDYRDEEGQLLFQVGRQGTGDTKQISQRRPNNRGQWLHQLGDARRVLYRLQEVLKAHTVIICEGEKDADALNAELQKAELLGPVIATTNPHGAEKWRDEFSPTLAGKEIIVWPDADERGKAHAQRVCQSVAPHTAQLKCIAIPEAHPKDGASDYFARGGTLTQFWKITEATPIWGEEPKPIRFPRTTLKQLLERPRLNYLIDGIFIERGTGVVSADYGGFKSFLMLDMALSVATGRPWQGREVKRGAVVYITPEGAYESADRLRAWMIRHGVTELPENFELIEMPVQIAEPTHLNSLIEELRDFAPSLVILDTVAKCNVGRDENDAATMSLFTSGMEKIAYELSAFVLAVHHNNKGGTARGSNSLPANVDASITLKPSPGNVVTVECDRVKGKPFEPFSLIGRVVELGTTDEQGRPLSSLVFEPTAQQPENNLPKADQTREQVFGVLKDAAEGLSASDRQRRCEAQLGIKSSRFYDHRDALVKAGRVAQNNRKYTFTPITPITLIRSQSEPTLYSDYSDDALASEQSEHLAGVGYGLD